MSFAFLDVKVDKEFYSKNIKVNIFLVLIQMTNVTFKHDSFLCCLFNLSILKFYESMFYAIG